jgi:hypothetical protein
MAVAALVLGITGIVFCFLGLLTLAQVVLAIIFGSLGIRRAGRGASGRGLALTGLVLGIVGAVLYLIIGAVTVGALWII